MKHYLAILLISLSFSAFTQNQNPGLQVDRANKWYFGRESVPFANDAPGLHFINGSPIVLNEGGFGRGTTISNPLSNLQLSGTQKIFDRTHVEMLNSNNDLGHLQYGNRDALAVHKPGNPDTIYYFTVPGNFHYSIIDMNANAGLGAVVAKNITLYSGLVGTQLAAVHHCNGIDVWVVTHEFNSRKFLAYLVTENGIDTIPVISELEPLSNNSIQSGRLKFSSNGSKVAITFSGFTIPPYLYDFDKTTGIVSNPIPLQNDIGETGVSFSPDNSKLYVGTNNGKLLQYDIEAGNANDIVLSMKIIADIPQTGFSKLQLGRDGKIYVNQGGSSSPPYSYSAYLGVISSPNLPDTLCNYNPYGLYLNGAFTSDGLMNTIESYFYSGSSAFPCYGDTLVSAEQPEQSELNTKVYPNPFSDYAYIDINGVNTIGQEQITYQLYDVLGRIYQPDITELQTHNGIIKLLMKKGNLHEGYYFLTVHTSHKTHTLKLSIF